MSAENLSTFETQENPGMDYLLPIQFIQNLKN